MLEGAWAQFYGFFVRDVSKRAAGDVGMFGAPSAFSWQFMGLRAQNAQRVNQKLQVSAQLCATDPVAHMGCYGPEPSLGPRATQWIEQAQTPYQFTWPAISDLLKNILSSMRLVQVWNRAGHMASLRVKHDNSPYAFAPNASSQSSAQVSANFPCLWAPSMISFFLERW